MIYRVVKVKSICTRLFRRFLMGWVGGLIKYKYWPYLRLLSEVIKFTRIGVKIGVMTPNLTWSRILLFPPSELLSDLCQNVEIINICEICRSIKFLIGRLSQDFDTLLLVSDWKEPDCNRQDCRWPHGFSGGHHLHGGKYLYKALVKSSKLYTGWR